MEGEDKLLTRTRSRDSVYDAAEGEITDMAITQPDTAVSHYGPLSSSLEIDDLARNIEESEFTTSADDNVSCSNTSSGYASKCSDGNKGLTETSVHSSTGDFQEQVLYCEEKMQGERSNDRDADRSCENYGEAADGGYAGQESVYVNSDTSREAEEVASAEEADVAVAEKAGSCGNCIEQFDGDRDSLDGGCSNHGRTCEDRTSNRATQQAQKKVCWMLAQGTELDSAPVDDELSLGDHSFTETMASVESAEQLHTDSLEASTLAAGEDKGIKEPGGTVNSLGNKELTTQVGVSIVNHDLNALENRTATPTENETPTVRAVSETGSASSVPPFPHCLAARRPLSASGALTRTQKLLDTEDPERSQGEASRPFSAKPAVGRQRRRLSLPLNDSRPSSRQQLCVSAVRVNGGPTAAFLETPGTLAPSSGPTPTPDAEDLSQKPARAGTTKLSAARPQSSPSLRQTVRRRSTPRPMTANETLRTWDMQFSKEELRRALPRRNFFSCHSQALKDAGYEVENDSPRRRRRLFFFNHQEEDEIAKVSASNQKQAPPIIKEPPGAGEGMENGTGVADHDKENVNGQDKTSDHLVETAVSLLTFAEKAKRRRSSVMPHQPQVVECRPLMQYLTYVRDNPTEYRQMIAKTHSPGSSHHHANTAAASDPATIHLLQMGRAFQARHAGGERADDVIRAAYALRPRSADPNRFAKLTREKSPLVPGLMSKRESTVAALGGGGMGGGGGVGQRGSKPGSEDHRHRQEAAPAEHMTEMEKRRQRAEEWTKSVTTDQLVRAKLHVLKELGHEEHELSKWWLAFRDCFYIRPKHR